MWKWLRGSESSLCFGCNQCGDCCRQMRIPPSHRDLLRIQTQHSEPLHHWLQFYPLEATHPDVVWLEQQPGMLLLRQQSGACVFLKDNACSIYNVRPRVCRIWPFEETPSTQTPRGESPLRIAPQHQMLVSLACDQTPVSASELAKTRYEMQHIEQEYRVYHWLIQRWNAEKKNAATNHGLEEFMDYLKETDKEVHRG